MSIPLTLLHLLSKFVVDHYASRGCIADPVTLGETCGVLTRAWSRENAGVLEAFGLSETEVIAWGERYGKHVGVFFFQERGV